MITSIGLMSGTSCDGIDSSIIESDGENKVNFMGDLFLPYSPETKSKIRQLKDKINVIKDLKSNEIEIKLIEKEITLLHAKCPRCRKRCGNRYRNTVSNRRHYWTEWAQPSALICRCNSGNRSSAHQT